MVIIFSNKYYTRLYLDPNPVPFSHLDLSQPLKKDDLENAIRKVGLPAIIKPCGGDGAKSIKKISSLEVLSAFVDDVRKNYRSIILDTTDYMVEHLAGKGIVPREKSEGLILEQYVDAMVKVSLDGYVCNKEVIHWSMGDNIYWKSHPAAYKMSLVPSELSDQCSRKSGRCMIRTRLIGYGYNNGGLNQEFLVCKDETVRLMEVNPRPTMVNCKAYCQLLENGDYVGTCLQANLGIPPKDLPLDKAFCCFGFHCTVPGTIDDLVDVDVVESPDLPSVYLKGWKRGDFVYPMGDGGTTVVGGGLVGSSREDVLQKHQNLYDRITKVHLLGSPCY